MSLVAQQCSAFGWMMCSKVFVPGCSVPSYHCSRPAPHSSEGMIELHPCAQEREGRAPSRAAQLAEVQNGPEGASLLVRTRPLSSSGRHHCDHLMKSLTRNQWTTDESKQSVQSKDICTLAQAEAQ